MSVVNIIFYMSCLNRVGRRESPSGFGFELTFRLKKQVGESSPPSWPAELLQSLARYVFRTGRIRFTFLVSFAKFRSIYNLSFLKWLMFYLVQ